MTRIIGLSGGIATGKSTLAQMFKEEKIPVIDADVLAKRLLEKGEEGYRAVVDYLGERILAPDGTICRRKLADLIFTDATVRRGVNERIHPKVIDIIHAEISAYKAYNPPFIVVDVPLLFESGFSESCDTTVLVSTDRETQIERLMRRDGIDRDYAETKIDTQMPLEEKKKLADHVIDNSRNILDTKKSFKKLMETLKEGERNEH